MHKSFIGSRVPQEGYEWYDGEIPQLTDYDLQYHKWQDGKNCCWV